MSHWRRSYFHFITNCLTTSVACVRVECVVLLCRLCFWFRLPSPESTRRSYWSDEWPAHQQLQQPGYQIHRHHQLCCRWWAVISEHRPSKQILFCYVHDHETVNYSQHFVNLATVATWRWYHTGPLVGVQGNLEARIRSDVPTSAIVRRWVQMATKATWHEMHVCSVFWLGYLAIWLSPSPRRNPEADNKQT